MSGHKGTCQRRDQSHAGFNPNVRKQKPKYLTTVRTKWRMSILKKCLNSVRLKNDHCPCLEQKFAISDFGRLIIDLVSFVECVYIQSYLTCVIFISLRMYLERLKLFTFYSFFQKLWYWQGSSNNEG